MTTLTSSIPATATVTANTTNNQSQPDSHADGLFDAAIGIPPAHTELGSPYFTAYIKTAIVTGTTPF
jgi:hypothetical protein